MTQALVDPGLVAPAAMPTAPAPAAATAGSSPAAFDPNTEIVLDRADGSSEVVTLQKLADRYLDPPKPASTVSEDDLRLLDIYKRIEANDPKAYHDLVDFKVKSGAIQAPPAAGQDGKPVTPVDEMAAMREEMRQLKEQLGGASKVTESITLAGNLNRIRGIIGENAAKLPFLAKHPEAAGMVYHTQRQIAQAYGVNEKSAAADHQRVLAQAMATCEQELKKTVSIYAPQPAGNGAPTGGTTMVNDQDMMNKGSHPGLPASLTIGPNGELVRSGKIVQQTGHGTMRVISDAPLTSQPTGPNVVVQQNGAVPAGPKNQAAMMAAIRQRRAELGWNQ